MKTPEEIKKGLECCGNSGKCKGCPYYGGYELCMGTLSEDALAYVQQLEQRLVEVNKTSPRWISVGERLPENKQKVIATFKNEGGIIVDQARYSNGEFDFASWAYVWHENITHWMPMPELPGTEESNEREQA